MAKKKQTKKGFLSRLIGRKDDEEAPKEEAAAGNELADANTLAPGAVPPVDPNAPWHKPPEHSGETGHVSFGPGQGPQGVAQAPKGQGADLFDFDRPDPLSGGERTMAPGYAGAPGGKDPFGFDPNELTMAPGYAHPGAPGGAKPGAAKPGAGADPFGGQTMAPGYFMGGKPGAAPGKSPAGGDPFGAGELTMAPGYAGPGGPAGGADPFGPGPGELTMAPGYAGPGGAKPGPKGAAPADPFGPAPGEMTMAPGYAGGADPFGGPDLGDRTMAPGYFGTGGPAQARPGPGAPGGGMPGGGAPDPFGFDASDLTMAPGYHGGGPAGPAQSAGAAGPAPSARMGRDPGLSHDELSFDRAGGGRAAAPAGPGPAAPVGGGLEDPFGPPLLDDPFGPAPVAPAPAGTPPPPFPVGAGGAPGAGSGSSPVLTAIEEGDEVLDLSAPGFQGERTMVDLNRDIDQLATLEDEAPVLDLGGPEALAPAAPGALAPGARPAPPRQPGAPPLPARPAGPRPLFQVARPDGSATVFEHPAPEVQLDPARGLLFAPACPGGWSRVPPGCAVLSDGSVVGRVAVVNGAVRAPGLGPDGGLTFPAGTQVDPETRAVLVPAAARAELGWRPELAYAQAEGLVFFLPAGAKLDPDKGTWVLPPAPTAVSAAPPDPRHGRSVGRLSYLGVTEVLYEDGWARLELPPEATFDPEAIQLPGEASSRGAPPALLRPRRLPDGRLELPLPEGCQSAGPGAVWIPPVTLREPGRGEPLELPAGDVVDTREYGGITDELLSDGWIRLHLPPGAGVVDGQLRLPAEYALAMSPEVRLEWDRTDDGALSWALPSGSEALGSVVLIPPAGHAEPSPPRKPAARRASPQPSPAPPEPAKPVEAAPQEEKGGAENGSSSSEAEGGTRRVKALDRFRKGKARDDQADTAETAPAEIAPVGTAPAQTAPAESGPAETGPAETGPAGESPAAAANGNGEAANGVAAAEPAAESAAAPVASPFDPAPAADGPKVPSPFDPPSASGELEEAGASDEGALEETSSEGSTSEESDGRRGRKKKRKR